MRKISIPKIFRLTVLYVPVLLILHSCQTYNYRHNYKNVNALIHSSDSLQTKPFLKAHMKNGDVCIFQDKWEVNETKEQVSGYATRYDFNRSKTYEGSILIPADSVAIFETNIKPENPESSRIASLCIITGIDVIMGVYCILNPKACFGSCPTF
ncbi:MAG: hypothetical protein NTW49_06255, partial [Bacteroidia bacterium]|nr:hypothetical protein [Bacteroidia bacterium]